AGAGAPLERFSAGHALLIGAVHGVGRSEVPAARREAAPMAGLLALGRWGHGVAGDAVGILSVFGAFCRSLAALVTFRRRMRWTAFVGHLDRAGLRAVPIIALMSFLIGMVVA